MNNIDNRWLDDMYNRKITPTSSSWIERAVEQKNSRMTIDLASSALHTYNDWDKIILQMQALN